MIKKSCIFCNIRIEYEYLYKGAFCRKGKGLYRIMNKLYYNILCFGFLVLLLTGCQKTPELSMVNSGFETALLETVQTETAPETVEIPAETESAKICVYVCGQVEHPGVYELASSSRVYQAISEAGGLTEKAAQEAVNQAASLEDGQQIYIPSKEEASQQTAGAAWMEMGNQGGSAAGEQTSALININQAGAEELMTLPGIGESRAADIITYRETNGPFAGIEDIKNVSGIKDAVFQKIKDKIVV